jgi:flagellar L-ring protein precursor FlgH
MPEYVRSIPSPIQTDGQNNGSLFNRGVKPIFGDRKARRVNDLLMIVISENAMSSTTANKSLNDKSDYALGGGLIGAKDTNAPDGLVNALSGLNNLSNIKFDSSSSSSFNGGGSNTRNESFSTTITARIIKVMSNDTYYVRGTRELLINGEHQYVSITGIVRADDISASNTINSTYLSDAKVYYDTKGSIAISSRMSWGAKLLKTIWPF